MGENIALFYLDGDTNEVTEVFKIIPVLKHIYNVGMLKRNHSLEAGIRLDLDGVIPQKQRQHGEDDKNDWPIIEDQPFEKGFGLGRGQIVLALVMLRVGHSKAPLLFVRLLPHQGVIEGFFHGRL